MVAATHIKEETGRTKIWASTCTTQALRNAVVSGCGPSRVSAVCGKRVTVGARNRRRGGQTERHQVKDVGEDEDLEDNDGLKRARKAVTVTKRSERTIVPTDVDA